MRRAGHAALALLILCCALALGVSGSAAQDQPSLTIRSVDATDSENVAVTFSYAGDRGDLGDLTVREAGDLVQASTAVPLSDQQQLGIVLVIDVSRSMEENALIERVLEAAEAFIDAKAVTDAIAIVSFSAEIRVEQEFTTDKAVLKRALGDLALSASGTNLYDGIVRSAALFRDSERQANLVLFSDGEDTGSSNSAERAKAAVSDVGGALFALGVENPGFDSIAEIARATGGTAGLADDPGAVGALFEGVQATLQKQYVTSFPSRVGSGAVDITLSVGDQQTTGEFIVGSNQAGTENLKPLTVEEPSGPSFLRKKTGLMIGLLLVAAAVFALALNLGSTFLGRESLSATLSPYSEGFVASRDPDSEYDEDDGGDGRGQSLTQTALLQRAVEATSQIAERQGILTTVEAKLERANLPLRPAEAIFFYVVGVFLLVVIALVVTTNLIGTLVIGAFAAMIPYAVLNFLASRRQKQFDSMLPDTLQLLASTLRAGYSLMQGVEAVSQEVAEPVGRELRRVVTEARLGRPLEESLDGIAERMGSADFEWAVMAIRIQREVGGNLAELLMTVAETMTERERLRRDVNALTAEGRVSAVVLGILPIGIGGFILSTNPDYMDPLFDGTTGKFLLGGAGVLMAAGFLWMKKLIEIEI